MKLPFSKPLKLKLYNSHTNSVIISLQKKSLQCIILKMQCIFWATQITWACFTFPESLQHKAKLTWCRGSTLTWDSFPWIPRASREAFTKAMPGLQDNGRGLYWLARALQTDPHYPSCTSKGKSHLIFFILNEWFSAKRGSGECGEFKLEIKVEISAEWRRRRWWLLTSYRGIPSRKPDRMVQ